MPRDPLQRVPPPFRQIADHYALKIRTGHLKPGDYLPSLPEIQATWGVSRATVSKATDRLKISGVVESIPGRGLRVIGKPAADVSDTLTPSPPPAAPPRRTRPAPKPAERRTP